MTDSREEEEEETNEDLDKNRTGIIVSKKIQIHVLFDAGRKRKRD